MKTIPFVLSCLVTILHAWHRFSNDPPPSDEIIEIYSDNFDKYLCPTNLQEVGHMAPYLSTRDKIFLGGSTIANGTILTLLNASFWSLNECPLNEAMENCDIGLISLWLAGLAAGLWVLMNIVELGLMADTRKMMSTIVAPLFKLPFAALVLLAAYAPLVSVAMAMLGSFGLFVLFSFMMTLLSLFHDRYVNYEAKQK